jgi:hypothetical protein
MVGRLSLDGRPMLECFRPLSLSPCSQGLGHLIQEPRRVHVNYFRGPGLNYEDCAPRTKWGLHNSFTCAFKALNPEPAFSAQLGLQRLLG